MFIDLPGSYFAITNPLAMIADWLNPYSHQKTVELNGSEVNVAWTRRADKAMQERDQVLLVEMQLYFSCVVQKRVLFHDEGSNKYKMVTGHLYISFHPVEAESCSPELFASQHPVRRELNSHSASRMRARQLRLDYKKGQWQGEFTI